MYCPASLHTPHPAPGVLPRPHERLIAADCPAADLGFKIKIKLPGDTAEDGDVVDGCDTTNTTAFIWWSTWFEFFMLILLSVAECGRVKGLYLTKQVGRWWAWAQH